MSTTASRSIRVGFTTATEGVEYFQEFAAASFSPSVADNKSVDLVAGNNTITVPVTAVAVTIIPPSDNTEVLTLKGVNGDTGIILSPSDPTSLGVDGISSLILNASDDVTVRIIIS